MIRKQIDKSGDQSTAKGAGKRTPTEGDIRAARWARENREAISIFNEDIELNGLWSDDFRLF